MPSTGELYVWVEVPRSDDPLLTMHAMLSAMREAMLSADEELRRHDVEPNDMRLGVTAAMVDEFLEHVERARAERASMQARIDGTLTRLHRWTACGLCMGVAALGMALVSWLVG